MTTAAEQIEPEGLNTDFYLHYRFADYIAARSRGASGASFYADTLETFAQTDENFENIRKSLQSDVSRKMRDSVHDISGGQVGDRAFKEYEALLDVFANPDESFQEMFQIEYDKNKINLATARQLADPSIAKSGKVFQIGTTPEELAAQFQNFALGLNKMIDDLFKTFFNGKSRDEFMNELIRQIFHKNYSALSGEEATRIHNELLSCFLTHEGFVKLKLNRDELFDGSLMANNPTMQTSFLNLLSAAMALQDAGVGLTNRRFSKGDSKAKGGVKKGIAKTESEVLGILIGKGQGHINNLNGGGAEIAANTAVSTLIEEFFQQEGRILQNLNLDQILGDNVEVHTKVTGGSLVEAKNSKNKIQKTVSKPDVSISITNDKVVINCGINVKQYKTSADKSKISTISLTSATSFREALYRSQISSAEIGYIYNLLVGHAGKGIRNKSSQVANQDLNEQWNNIKDAVIQREFVNALMGFDNEAGSYALVLSVNGHLYSIPQLVDKIAANNIGGSIRAKSSKHASGWRALSRAGFVKDNKWLNLKGEPVNADKVKESEKDAEWAVTRSQDLFPSILSSLNEVKLDITLKNIQAISGLT